MKQEGGNLFGEKRTAAKALASVVSPTSKERQQHPAVSSELETLNFKVPAAFKRRFKGYAVSHGITMVELLKEGFELSQNKRKPSS